MNCPPTSDLGASLASLLLGWAFWSRTHVSSRWQVRVARREERWLREGVRSTAWDQRVAVCMWVLPLTRHVTSSKSLVLIFPRGWYVCLFLPSSPLSFSPSRWCYLLSFFFFFFRVYHEFFRKVGLRYDLHASKFTHLKGTIRRVF